MSAATMMMTRPAVDGPAVRPTPEERWSARVSTTIQVVRNKVVVGELFLDADDRLLKRDPAIPAAVALKILVSYYRQDEMFGEVPDRDGSRFAWGVVSADE